MQSPTMLVVAAAILVFPVGATDSGGDRILVAGRIDRAVSGRLIQTRFRPEYFETIGALLGHLERRHNEPSRQQDAEHVGAIFRRADGSYAASHGIGRQGRDAVSFTTPRPADHEIIAYWHTHGAAGVLRDVFSMTDSELVRTTGRPFYLLAPNGEIRVLTPEMADRSPSRSTSTRRSLLGRAAAGYRGSLAAFKGSPPS